MGIDTQSTQKFPNLTLHSSHKSFIKTCITNIQSKVVIKWLWSEVYDSVDFFFKKLTRLYILHMQPDSKTTSLGDPNKHVEIQYRDLNTFQQQQKIWLWEGMDCSALHTHIRVRSLPFSKNTFKIKNDSQTESVEWETICQERVAMTMCVYVFNGQHLLKS